VGQFELIKACSFVDGVIPSAAVLSAKLRIPAIMLCAAPSGPLVKTRALRDERGEDLNLNRLGTRIKVLVPTVPGSQRHKIFVMRRPYSKDAAT
jgi:hypothetical protein